MAVCGFILSRSSCNCLLLQLFVVLGSLVLGHLKHPLVSYQRLVHILFILAIVELFGLSLACQILESLLGICLLLNDLVPEGMVALEHSVDHLCVLLVSKLMICVSVEELN